MKYSIGQIFEGEYPPEAAVFCNESGKAYIDEIESTLEGVRRFQIVAIPEPTADEIAMREAQERRAKAEANLRETDYIGVKIGEGAATREEYATELAQRQAWRDEVNQCEAIIAELTAKGVKNV